MIGSCNTSGKNDNSYFSRVDEGETTWFYEGYKMRKCADRSKTGHRDLIARVAAMTVATRGIE